jgi:uncharacterized protein (TIGR02996 family)
MHNDEIFLAKLAEEPADDTTRLVYADWLDEQGDSLSAAKAEFLRLTVQVASTKGRKGKGWKGWKKARRKRLQELAAALDTAWLAVVSRLPIENCLDKRRNGEEARPGGLPRVAFEFLCDRRWEDLQATGDRAVRFCDACRQNVHYCDTITEAREHAWEGHCIAVDLGVIRRERDLDPPLMLFGTLSPSFMRREGGRMQPDPVSAQREQRKREKQQGKKTR